MTRKQWRKKRATVVRTAIAVLVAGWTLLSPDVAHGPGISTVHAATAWSGNANSNAGMPPWATFDGLSLDSWLNLHVNVVNGNLIVATSGLDLPGVNGFDESIDPSYNSLSNAYALDMGNGWTMGTGRDIGLNLSTMTFYDGTGHPWTFSGDGTSGYVAPPGLDAGLVKNGDGTYTLTYNGTQEQLQFDANGYLTSDTNREGNQLQYFYDTNGKLTSIWNTEASVAKLITGSPDQITTIAYNAANQVSSVTDPAGRAWTYAYDSNGNLTSVTAPGNHVTTFGYDSYHDLTKITDPMNEVTLITYASPGRGGAISQIVRVTNTGTNTGPTWSFSSATGQVTDPNGHTTTYATDANGLITSITDAEGHVTKLSWTGDNQESQGVAPSGATTSYSYDGKNNPTGTTLPTGAASTAQYTNSTYPYNPSSTTDTEGNTTTYTYGNGRGGLLTSEKDALGHTTSYTYASYTNAPASVTDANGHVTTYAYNTDGLQTQVTPPSPLGSQSFTYNTIDQKATSTDGKGQITSYTYDALGELTKVAYGDGRTISYTYDADGNQTSMTGSDDNQSPIGNGGFESGQSPWQTSSATNDQIVSTSKAHSGSYSAHLCGVNSCNDQIWQTVSVPAALSSGTLTFWMYITTQEPVSSLCHDYFNPQLRTSTGTVIATLQALCNRNTTPTGWVQKTFDLSSYLAAYKGQQVEIAFQGTTDSTYPSDFWVDDVAVTFARATSDTYNLLNQQTQEQRPDGSTVAYSWDGASNLLSKTDAGGGVSYGYSALDQVNSVTDPQNNKTTLSYDQDGNLTQVAYPNGVTQTRTLDSAGQILVTEAANASGTTLASSTYTYANPANGKQTTQRYSLKDAAGNTTTYTYDALDRLTGAVETSSSGTGLANDTYAYDPVGNMTSETLNGTATAMAYNAADELTSAGSTTYSFDANGNETSASGGKSYAYNAADQTTSITPPGQSAIAMSYEGQGQTQRTASGPNAFQYDATGISSWNPGSGSVYFTRTPSGGLLSERTASGTYYYLYDGLGSVVGLTDSAGNVVNTYSYDPYGNSTGATGTVSNPFRYIGAVWDSATGLYKMGARYYDPSVGRFTQLDPVGTGYSYAGDDPTTETDPSGLMSDDPAEYPAGGGADEGGGNGGGGDPVTGGKPRFDFPKAGDVVRLDEKYLKRLRIDAEAVKKEWVGAEGRRYDLYQDKSDGSVWLYRKQPLTPVDKIADSLKELEHG